MFETFIRGHNFGELMLDKLPHDKNYYICDPIDSAFEYWKKIGKFDYIFEFWCDEFNATPEESADIKNKRFKSFMTSDLHWNERSYKEYIEYINCNSSEAKRENKIVTFDLATSLKEKEVDELSHISSNS